jgi:hypothetical protein
MVTVWWGEAGRLAAERRAWARGRHRIVDLVELEAVTS